MGIAVLMLLGCGNSGPFAQLDDVDLMGATLDRKALDSSGACAQWCADVPACEAYTYGTSVLGEKYRRRCYLKKIGFKMQRTRGFMSGIKRR